MGTGTWVIIGISAWIVLSLPIGLLIGALVRTSRRAPRRPAPSTTTRAAMTGSAHISLAPRAAAARPDRIAQLVQV